eukprot:m.196933 g.196933  ORF g.196933 m.196933 type:complete len:447 (-) comp19951_c0_seq1:86-1426(-)
MTDAAPSADDEDAFLYGDEPDTTSVPSNATDIKSEPGHTTDTQSDVTEPAEKTVRQPDEGDGEEGGAVNDDDDSDDDEDDDDDFAITIQGAKAGEVEETNAESGGASTNQTTETPASTTTTSTGVEAKPAAKGHAEPTAAELADAAAIITKSALYAGAEIDGTNVYEFQLDSLEEKGWTKPGANIKDFFNYGFNEETWRLYCAKQRALREEYKEKSKISVVGQGKPTHAVPHGGPVGAFRPPPMQIAMGAAPPRMMPPPSMGGGFMVGGPSTGLRPPLDNRPPFGWRPGMPVLNMPPGAPQMGLRGPPPGPPGTGAPPRGPPPTHSGPPPGPPRQRGSEGGLHGMPPRDDMGGPNPSQDDRQDDYREHVRDRRDSWDRPASHQDQHHEDRHSAPRDRSRREEKDDRRRTRDHSDRRRDGKDSRDERRHRSRRDDGDTDRGSKRPRR